MRLDNPDTTDCFAAFRFATDIQPEPLQWLWPNRIPLAKLTLLVGDPGVGKSLLAADFAARVSAARPWPDADPSQPQANGAHCGVVYAAAEDDPADTLLPRLNAANADLNTVCLLHGVTDTYQPYPTPNPQSPLDAAIPDPRSLIPDPSIPLTLPTHLPALAQAVRACTVPRLVILDPLHAFLSPLAQSSVDGLAAVLHGLADIAHTYGPAVLAVGHLAKSSFRRIIYRVRGSLAAAAAARSILLVSPDPDDPNRRYLSPIKSVYAAPPPPLAFRIVDASTPDTNAPQPPAAASDPLSPSATGHSPCPAPRIEWDRNPCDSLPPYLLDLPPESHSALLEAIDWLLCALAPGPRPVQELITAARATGHALITLRRAKRALSARSIRPGGAGSWLWALPQHQQKLDDQGGVSE